MINPYQKQHVTAAGEPLPENLRFRGQTTPAIAGNGEMNASSKKDLMLQIGNLLDAAVNGEIRTATVAETRAQVSRQRAEILANAYYDPAEFQALGEVMVEDIAETTYREGFVRKVMGFKELTQGELPRVRYKEKNVVAYTAASASEVVPSIVRNNERILPEFYISTNIKIEERDIGRATGDLLEEKYQEGLEAIMVQEDRLWKKMADESIGALNTITYFTTFTPLHLQQIRSEVSGWGLPVAWTIIHYDLWNDIIGTTGFGDWFDPVHKHELILEGNLGSMLGTPILTDAFRQPELKVLSPGEIYVVAPPENHGTIQQRNDLSSNPVDGYAQGEPSRGWYIFETMAMELVNVKSIAGGKRS